MKTNNSLTDPTTIRRAKKQMGSLTCLQLSKVISEESIWDQQEILGLHKSLIMASEGNLSQSTSHKMAKEIVKIIMGSINSLKRLSSQGTMTTTTMVGITGNNLKQATSTTTKSKGLIKTTMEKGKVVDITKKGQG
jgi:hypothetical protein